MQNEIYLGDNLTIMNSDNFRKYENKIKMIYIDPPYNTGATFSYNDKKETKDWLLFMKDRLEIAKSLLKENGAIFISIDDSEYATLKVLCDSIFDKSNFIGTFITQQAQRSNAKYINIVHEYILCYAKNKSKLKEFKIKRIDIPEENKMITSISKSVLEVFNKEGIDKANKKLAELIKKNCLEYNITWLKNYSNIDENGEIFFAKDLSTPGKPRNVDIEEIDLHLDALPTRGWSSDKKFIDLHNKNLLCFKGGRPYEKHYLKNAEDNAPSILNYYSRQGTNDLNKLGLRDLFDTPKPVELIKFLIRLVLNEDNDVVLDFFAGSGTTAQAIYEVNKEDNKKYNYILIQLDEKVNEKTKAFEVCEKFNITPNLSQILLLRINTFLTQQKMKKDYLIITNEEEK